MIVTVMSWLTPLMAALIRPASRGPVFFIQRRAGKNRKPFPCLKFRTMRQNEEADERPATPGDDRIMRVGKTLRSLNIDELPQLFNVLAGHMSLIGPQPYMRNDCMRFSFVVPAGSLRYLVRPGITGLAQVHGYNGPADSYDSIIRRHEEDVRYIKKEYQPAQGCCYTATNRLLMHA